jgi:acyl carrier protein phosphodiesterase
VTLAAPTGEARLGALLGDFARGLDLGGLPAAVASSLAEHRAVDRFFDAQPEVQAAHSHFPPALRRFAGILIDVFVDHALVRHWEQLRPPHVGEASLHDVTASLYRALEDHASLLPPRLAQVAPLMIRDDWLAGYGALANVERALAGLARRLRRPTPLAEGIEVLRARTEVFDELAFTVFPRTVTWARGT